jgi:nucleoside-diphosphate-sugar epimerase
VSGASGFVGSHVVRRLLREGTRVTALSRPDSDPWRIADLLDDVEVAPLGDPRSLRGVEVVFHVGAAGVRPAGNQDDLVLEANVLGTQRLLAAALDAGVERVVYCGSCFEYGEGTQLVEDAPPRPRTAYAASKAAARFVAEAFSRRHGLPVVSLFLFTAYGPFEPAYRLVPAAIAAALDGRPLELTSGKQTRDFVHVEDAADAFLAAVAVDVEPCESFNVCSGTETPVRELAQTVVEEVGSNVELRLGALPHREDEIWHLSGDPSRAAARLGWRAKTPLRDGLASTIEWFAAERDRHPEYQMGAAA